MDWKGLIIAVALALGLTSNVVLLILWWAAATNAWHIHVTFNAYGEGWIEGVLLHSAAFLMLWAVWLVVFRLRRDWYRSE